MNTKRVLTTSDALACEPMNVARAILRGTGPSLAPLVGSLRHITASGIVCAQYDGDRRGPFPSPRWTTTGLWCLTREPETRSMLVCVMPLIRPSRSVSIDSIRMTALQPEPFAFAPTYAELMDLRDIHVHFTTHSFDPRTRSFFHVSDSDFNQRLADVDVPRAFLLPSGLFRMRSSNP